MSSQLDDFVNDVPKICIRMICITYFFHWSEIWSLQEELQPSVIIIIRISEGRIKVYTMLKTSMVISYEGI